ncbi:MAG: O-acetylhomoserine aminocarboxypropyltransferase/cysteine synthase [Planctomycetota bacterium]|jgi:O-acetylhomoserine (thiol)-lyase|nr:O-acetylhomoserine aminocarboxypropyltransferase/cysteine synthase [Planctomycetota bacterium]
MDHIDTLCVRGGYRPGNGEPRQPPIIQSTTFRYDSSEEMAALFDLEKSGYFYSRLQNPTCDNVAAKIALLEGGSAAMLTGSGQAATFFAVFNICGNGGHIVSSAEIYGGTFNLFAHTLRQMGIETTFLPVNCPRAEFDAAFRPNTKLVFGETLSNPSLSVLDIERYAETAHRHGVPLIVDNTFATPVNCRPFEWGADIVTHSTTKYMDGHGAALGGAIVDSGRFDWTRRPDAYPGLNRPDETYHGVVYPERFGPGGAYITKMVAQLMRDFGCVQSPVNAYLTNLGLESLHLRMKRHCESAARMAEYLLGHRKVSFVKYPSLPGDKFHALAEKYLPNGSCGVVGFGVHGGRAAAERCLNSLKRCNIATHVSDAQTCALHPASTTHRQMTDEQLLAAGIGPEHIRLSVGLEAVEDLVEDVRQALEKV